jgi:hypothetical protein
MPLARYFLFVGTALLALLFIVDAYLPKSPVVESANVDSANTAANMATNPSLIRIRSDRKWPERVEFDTSLPTITPAPVRTAEANVPAAVAVPVPVRMQDAFAQLQTPEPKKPEPKLRPKRRTVARSHAGLPTVLVAQQPRLGFFGNTIW